MAQTQFFEREISQLDEYKRDFKKALQMVETVGLFSVDVVDFLRSWIDAQKSYIPRQDVDSFLTHMKTIFKDKEAYDFITKELQGEKNNWNILEYSFNLISGLDDGMKGFDKYKKKQLKNKQLEEQKLQTKQRDEEEMQNLLSSIEQL